MGNYQKRVLNWVTAYVVCLHCLASQRKLVKNETITQGLLFSMGIDLL